MPSLNRVTIIGNLGQDPELRFLPNGQPCAKLSIATTETWKGKDGSPGEKTEWHKVVVWGNLAETCGEQLAKGRTVCVEGRLQTRSWQGDDGVKKYMTEINASNVLFMGGGKPPAQAADMGYGAVGGGAAPSDDDVPF